MSSEEQKEVAINRYVDLMRIKAHETGETGGIKNDRKRNDAKEYRRI